MSNSFENIIKENAKQYYTTGQQKISDEAFDALIEEVKKDNRDSEVLTTGWSYKPDSNNKIKHKYCHIGSLNKVKNTDDLIIKMQNSIIQQDNKSYQMKFLMHLLKLLNYFPEYCVSAKLDGLSCVLYYEKGELIKALTRGDGEYGLDITEKLSKIKGCKLSLCNTDFTGAVRGEIFMTPMDFNEYKLKYPEAANARNSTAGIINSKEIIDDLEYLSLYVYTVVANETELGPKSIFSLNSWLHEHFDFVVPYYPVLYDNLIEETLIKLKEEFEQEVIIDGLVITSYVVDYNIETKCYNYNQVAYKFQDEVKIAKVKHIEWTASKHNAYIPVIVFEEPIELEGTKVKRATGYNAKWVKDMKIKSGSIVAVRKANQIIPQIIEVIEN